jgi:hypothetical protein
MLSRRCNKLARFGGSSFSCSVYVMLIALEWNWRIEIEE